MGCAEDADGSNSEYDIERRQNTEEST